MNMYIYMCVVEETKATQMIYLKVNQEEVMAIMCSTAAILPLSQYFAG
jgi:hypothetical protein